MRPLGSHDIYRLVEWGGDKHPLDRAVALLQASLPERGHDALVALPMGRRDGLLLRLRAQTFGDRFDMHVACPACTEPLEFSLALDDLLVDPPDRPLEADVDGTPVPFRLPDSRDVAAVLHLDPVDQARRALVQRCVEAGDLTERAVEAVSEAMAHADPQADVAFNVDCPSCGHAWRCVFDALDYLWVELEAYATRLQDEVHTVASAYGWSEDVILSMPGARRRRYVERIAGA